jgi:RNA polymerase sigma factor (sigma-70 family)
MCVWQTGLKTVTAPLIDAEESRVKNTLDETLMQQIRGGDHQAFATLVGRHLDALHGFAQRLLGNPADADDIVQETFLRVWHKAEKWRPKSAKVSTWLHSIAHNLCIDFHRRNKGETVDIADVDLIDPHLPDDSRQQEDVAVQVKAALQQIPESQRSAIILCHYQGMSNREAAQALGISVSALESLMARGRRKLRNILQTQVADLLGDL